jgi:hypothetical protein
MYYIPTYTKTKDGAIDIRGSWLVTENSDLVFKFNHLTEKGYLSKKPLFIHFDYTINSDNEIEVSDEIAMELIKAYKCLKFKTFETSASLERSNSMTGMLSWASVMGDHGDTSGQFSR